jgi:hypothetical protein
MYDEIEISLANIERLYRYKIADGFKTAFSL